MKKPIKRIISFLLLFITLFSLNAQTDFSENWEDFFSYKHIVDFIQTDTKIVSLTDNALFIYDKLSGESKKISSVNGLSGKETSSLYYHEESDTILIGYENGLLEVIDSSNSIIAKFDIINFSITGSKRINAITAKGTKLFLSLPFGIVTFNIETNDFEETYFIGDASSEVEVNEIKVFNNTIYAATNDGLYRATADNPFLVNSSNWTQISPTSFSNITIFNNLVYVATNQNIYQVQINNQLLLINNQEKEILDLTATDTFLCVTTLDTINLYNDTFALSYSLVSEAVSDFPFTPTTAQTFDDELFIGTTNFGILESSLSSINDFTEIHPDGPLSNSPFSISVLNDNLWIVYGGFNANMVPLSYKEGIDHFNGEKWISIPYKDHKALDLTHVTIDPFNENKVYISSMNGAIGIVIIENDEVLETWDYLNSPLEKLFLSGHPEYISVRIGETIFDKDGNLWIPNSSVSNALKMYSSSGVWTSYDTSSLTGKELLDAIAIDKNENKWISSQSGGAWVLNKDISKMKQINAYETTGNLPHVDVNTLAVDDNNTMWIGTRQGLTTFNATSSFFEQATYETKPIVIASGEDDGFGIALLGTQTINSICVDGAQNKWFGTNNGGVLNTSPSGRETFLHFDKTNSPLPSNKILDIEFDKTTGKIYFATDKGIVAYDSKIAPYAAHLVDAYAYPNPVRKQHDFVTIDGRNGNHLPNGTNVKILDAAGRLVHETNVVSGQEQFGGKVTWDKTNLAGRKVASGIYVVLLTISDTSETAITKIAIIN